jgi:hypothetical protein
MMTILLDYLIFPKSLIRWIVWPPFYELKQIPQGIISLEDSFNQYVHNRENGVELA